MVLPLLLAIVGGFVLLVGADVAVEAAQGIARRFGVPALVIGLTLTSVGTSLPEIATNLAAAASSSSGNDASGIAVGNIVGSNLSQITLLMGVTGLVAGLKVPRVVLTRDGPVAVLALLAMFGVSQDGHVSQAEGTILVALYGLYTLGLLVGVRRSAAATRAERAPEDSDEAERSVAAHAVRLALGLAAVVGGAALLVGQAQVIAEAAGLPKDLVGLLVGVGTGLPELVVSMKAARSGDSGLALGNLIGSNITDPLLSFGLGAAVVPVTVVGPVLWLDFPFWGLSTVVALAFLATKGRLDRWEGGVLVAMFAVWTAIRLVLVG